MSTVLLGRGAIATYLRRQLDQDGTPPVAMLVRAGTSNAGDPVPWRHSVDQLPRDARLLVDCAGHSGLAEHGPDALRAGLDVLTVSLGALADARLYETLEAAAGIGNSTLHLASGAIGGLDVLRAARADGLNQVIYRGRKPPAGWRGSAAEEVVDLNRPLAAAVTHFQGSAREAALRYPKNANVAAAVALSGLGFDRTEVALIADPTTTQNIHEVDASGAFGEMTFRLSGATLLANPRTSALAAMSLLSAIRTRGQRVTF
ncbi:MAG: aspartate dehydrogenase [Pseudomonadota bacterium]